MNHIKITALACTMKMNTFIPIKLCDMTIEDTIIAVCLIVCSSLLFGFCWNAKTGKRSDFPLCVRIMHVLQTLLYNLGFEVNLV